MKTQIILSFFMAIMILLLPVSAVLVTNDGLSADLIEQSSSSETHIQQNGTSSSSLYEDISNDISLSDFKTDIFRILDLSTNEILTVPAFDYVVGAVASEMPYTYHEEALKAQAVSAYTYALRVRYQNQKSKPDNLNGADFSAEPSKYLGFMTEEIARERFGEKFDEIWKKITNSVNDVFGEVIVYDEEPIIAAYHSLSSGKTETAENVWGYPIEYLVAVNSDNDILAEDYLTIESFTLTQVEQSLTSKYPNIKLPEDKNAWFNILKRSESGTVLSLTVGSEFLKGSDIRSLFGLRSSNFTVTYQDEVFSFNVLGYGHGVGLSQQGANAMAENGASYKDILLHYYSNV
ncbi:MAG: stage II sporulation protein D, partial [Oscillospiraceae bacterium]|nr:stage II sporulation protein D [Oscillospiraceae bacterium]